MHLNSRKDLPIGPCGCFFAPTGGGGRAKFHLSRPARPKVTGMPERQLRPGGPCHDVCRLRDTHDTQRTLFATAVRHPAVGPRWESPQDSLILVFQLALSSRHSTRTRHRDFDGSSTAATNSDNHRSSTTICERPRFIGLMETPASVTGGSPTLRQTISGCCVKS